MTSDPSAQSEEAAAHVLGLHLVHSELTSETGQASGVPQGYMIAQSSDDVAKAYLIEKEALLTNADFAEVSASFDQYTLSPIIRFRLKPAGAKVLETVTTTNVGRAFAIVIDGKVVSAPIIQSSIASGEGVISGGFSVEEAQSLVKRMSADISE